MKIMKILGATWYTVVWKLFDKTISNDMRILKIYFFMYCSLEIIDDSHCTSCGCDQRLYLHTVFYSAIPSMLYCRNITHLGEYSTLEKNKFAASIDSDIPFASIIVEEFEVSCCLSEIAKGL